MNFMKNLIKCKNKLEFVSFDRDKPELMIFWTKFYQSCHKNYTKLKKGQNKLEFEADDL